jgi:hypothetical protein
LEIVSRDNVALRLRLGVSADELRRSRAKRAEDERKEKAEGVKCAQYRSMVAILLDHQFQLEQKIKDSPNLQKESPSSGRTRLGSRECSLLS